LARIVAEQATGQAPFSIDGDSSTFIAAEIEAESEREKIIRAAELQLQKLNPMQEQFLIEKIRKTIPDMATPLKRSSTTMDIEIGNDNKRIATFNQRRINQISAVIKDDSSIRIFGRFKKFDRETGYGSFRPNGSRSVLNFSIPREIFFENKQLFLDAYALDNIGLEAIPYRDGIGNIARLIVLSVVQPDEPQDLNVA